jgi:hypothetical protein
MVTPIPIKGVIPEWKNKICAISTTTFQYIINNANKCYGKVEQFTLFLNEINTALQELKDDMPDRKAIVPPEYHKYLKIFEKVNADKLPPHHPYDHKIPLGDGFQPPFGPLYFLSHPELEELKRWLDENLSKGFIHASSSLAMVPILFLKKGDIRYALLLTTRELMK